MTTVGRVVTPRLKIAWNGSTYVDETVNLISARGSTKLVAPGSAIMSPRGIVDQMTLSLYNRNETSTGRRYSPLNTAGALYSSLTGGGSYHRPVQFDVSIDGGAYARIFTGVIKIPQEGTPTLKNEATVDIDCRSVDEDLLQLKMSTDILTFAAQIDHSVDEAQLIADVLEDTAVGLSPSDYILDSGLFSIPFMWLDDESALEELWQLAAATGGRLYADPDGKIVYENMQSWLFNSSSTETFTRASFDALRLKYDDSNLYSSITVEASPRKVGTTATLWEPDEQIIVPASGTRVVTAKLKQPAYSITEVTCNARTAAGASLTADLSLSHADYAQRVEITLTNANATYAAILSGLAVIGLPVDGAPTLEETATSTAAFWVGRKARSRSIRGNVYIQSRAQAKALAEFLRDTQEAPKLTYSMSNVAGVAARRLGARVTINDTVTMSASRDAFVTGITWTMTDKGYRQTIDAIDAANIFKYASSDYFILNTSTLNGGKRVFY
jgi:hypothetical protein